MRCSTRSASPTAGHHYPSQLSGGEQQRIALARALANDPPILLADEPTGNLDHRQRPAVMEVLFDVRRSRGATLVLVTHDLELAGRADAVLRLRGGPRGAGRGGIGRAFVARMAWREIRASWRRLIFFFLCLSLGVAAIVALRSVVGSVRVTLTREARALVGADLAISTNRPWDPKVRAAIEARLRSRRSSPEATTSRRSAWCGLPIRGKRPRAWWS